MYNRLRLINYQLEFEDVGYWQSYGRSQVQYGMQVTCESIDIQFREGQVVMKKSEEKEQVCQWCIRGSIRIDRDREVVDIRVEDKMVK